ncbi:hypothetical protein [Streptomyces sp. NPDC013489]|uniref:hypothetical protein n=1 Tax=Streptomyces sp. NPDC013489 TaxID=3155606 RepID=UPI0033C60F3E
MQPTDGATATANPSWVAADMDALIRQCEARLAEHDGQLGRLAAGVATLNAEIASVRAQRQETVDTREEALRVQETLLAATRAGVALRSGQHQGPTRVADTPEPDQEGTGSGTDAAAAPPAADAPPAEENSVTAETDPPVAFDASKLGPRGMQALQIITGTPGQQWTPKLLAIQLEGQEAAADQKAHNRARTLMDDLAKKQLLAKEYREEANRRLCYFVAASAAGAA